MAEHGHQRLALLDTIRGVTLINMIVYHGCWNLVYLYEYQWEWYTGIWGSIWQQGICWIFILLSGFCWQLGHHPVMRGLLVLGSGVVVSSVTAWFIPENRILFGILTMLGSCMLLTYLLHPLLRKIPATVGAAGSLVLFLGLSALKIGTRSFLPALTAGLPRMLQRSLLAAFLGFPIRSFRSADYFPLLPWVFLFLTGYFVMSILQKHQKPRELLSRGKIPMISVLGRYSLPIYLLHQPVLYGIFHLILT